MPKCTFFRRTAMTNKVVGEQTSVTAAQMAEFWRQVAAGTITREQFQAFLEHRSPFGCSVPGIDWPKVYEVLGMEAEYAEAVNTLDVTQGEGLWTIPVVQGVTCNKLVAALRKLGVNVYTYVDDLDKGVPTNDRSPDKKSYLVSFRRNVEADPDNKNRSANDLAKVGHMGITLLERLLLELGYFLATGKHLDVSNWTLCSGSRRSNGSVPYVNFRDGKVYVLWCHPGAADDNVRSRSVVS